MSFNRSLVLFRVIFCNASFTCYTRVLKGIIQARRKEGRKEGDPFCYVAFRGLNCIFQQIFFYSRKYNLEWARNPHLKGVIKRTFKRNSISWFRRFPTLGNLPLRHRTFHVLFVFLSEFKSGSISRMNVPRVRILLHKLVSSFAAGQEE